MQHVQHQRRSSDGQKPYRRGARAVAQAMPGVERRREEAAGLPFEEVGPLFVPGPDLRQTGARQDVDQLVEQVLLRFEAACRPDLADGHARQTFHTLELDVGFTPAESWPVSEVQALDV